MQSLKPKWFIYEDLRKLRLPDSPEKWRVRREAEGDGEMWDLNRSGAVLDADRHGAVARVLSCEVSSFLHIFLNSKILGIFFCCWSQVTPRLLLRKITLSLFSVPKKNTWEMRFQRMEAAADWWGSLFVSLGHFGTCQFFYTCELYGNFGFLGFKDFFKC